MTIGQATWGGEGKMATAKGAKGARVAGKENGTQKPPTAPSSSTQALTLKAGRYLIQHLGIDGTASEHAGRVYPFAILFAPDRVADTGQFRFLGSDGPNLARLITPGDRTIVDLVGHDRTIFMMVFNAPGTQSGVRIGVKKLPADAIGERPVPAYRIVAHLQDIGDQRLNGSGWIGFRDSRLRLEGLSIALSGAPSDRLEYLVNGAGEQSKWTVSGQFVGTRGRAKGLTQFAARLRGDLAEHFSTIYQARFSESGETKVLRDGEVCNGGSPQDFLVALRFAIVLRRAPAQFPSSATLNRIAQSDVVEINDIAAAARSAQQKQADLPRVGDPASSKGGGRAKPARSKVDGTAARKGRRRPA